jgi:hypothetical protein
MSNQKIAVHPCPMPIVKYSNKLLLRSSIRRTESSEMSIQIVRNGEADCLGKQRVTLRIGTSVRIIYYLYLSRLLLTGGCAESRDSRVHRSGRAVKK